MLERIEPVVSGKPYPVASVDGTAPSRLDAFLSSPTISVDLDAGSQHLFVAGAGRADGDGVVLNEKGDDGVGKDIRTWLITAADGTFYATPQSAF